MKTAVLLSGHLRTWHLCKDMLVDAMHNIYGTDIDWFVVIWKTSTATEDEVRDFLLSKNVNLKSIKFIDLEMNKFRRGSNRTNDNLVPDSLWQVTSSISGPSYLKQLVSRDKRIYEFQNDIIYERVIYARPDTVYFYNKNYIQREHEFPVDVKHFSMHIRGDFHEQSYTLVSPNTHDVLPVTGSLSSDVYGFMHLDFNEVFGADRRVRLRGGETHAHVSYFLNRHLISLDMRAHFNNYHSYVWPVVVRPTSDIEKFRQEYDNWDMQYISSGEHDQFWFESTDYNKKIEWCEKMNIDKRDYDF